MNITDAPGQGTLLELSLRGQRYFALVISPEEYNRKSGRMLVCLLSTSILGYPFEVNMHLSQTATEINTDDFVILADRVDNLDWQTLEYVHRGQVTQDVLKETMGKLEALIRYS